MAEQQSNNQGHTTADSLKAKGQALLDKAIAQEPVKPDCRHSYGLHQWIQHEETLMEFCSVCKIRKDVWDEATKSQPSGNQQATEKALNNAEKTLENVPEHLREHAFKEGNKMGRGRPLGSKNLTTLFREALKHKEYTLKDEATGQTLKIKAESALVEKALENAIKKGDRESIRMIWEMLDGKPTQQHKIEVNGAKGYQVDPDREKMIHEQFGLYSDRLEVVPVAETHRIAPVEVERVKTIETPTQTQNPTPEAREVAKTGVIEPQPHATNINQPNTGVIQATPSVAGGVREA